VKVTKKIWSEFTIWVGGDGKKMAYSVENREFGIRIAEY
jgi:hypothetical protein